MNAQKNHHVRKIIHENHVVIAIIIIITIDIVVACAVTVVNELKFYSAIAAPTHLFVDLKAMLKSVCITKKVRRISAMEVLRLSKILQMNSRVVAANTAWAATDVNVMLIELKVKQKSHRKKNQTKRKRLHPHHLCNRFKKTVCITL